MTRTLWQLDRGTAELSQTNAFDSVGHTSPFSTILDDDGGANLNSNVDFQDHLYSHEELKSLDMLIGLIDSS